MRLTAPSRGRDGTMLRYVSVAATEEVASLHDRPTVPVNRELPPPWDFFRINSLVHILIVNTCQSSKAKVSALGVNCTTLPIICLPLILRSLINHASSGLFLVPPTRDSTASLTGVAVGPAYTPVRKGANFLCQKFHHSLPCSRRGCTLVTKRPSGILK